MATPKNTNSFFYLKKNKKTKKNRENQQILKVIRKYEKKPTKLTKGVKQKIKERKNVKLITTCGH